MREALAEGGARGSTRVTLDVLAANEARGRGVWRAARLRAGARTRWRRRSTPSRRGSAATHRRRTAPIYVQTDDHDAVEQRGREVPAADRPLRSRRTSPSRATAGRSVDDELCSRDPKALRRLGRELSLAIGAIVLTLGDRGGRRRPLHPLGPGRDRRRVRLGAGATSARLPPGDVVALGANPTVAQRLTGADPDAACGPSPAPPPPSTSFRRRRSCTRSWPTCSG